MGYYTDYNIHVRNVIQQNMEVAQNANIVGL